MIRWILRDYQTNLIAFSGSSDDCTEFYIRYAIKHGWRLQFEKASLRHKYEQLTNAELADGINIMFDHARTCVPDASYERLSQIACRAMSGVNVDNYDDIVGRAQRYLEWLDDKAEQKLINFRKQSHEWFCGSVIVPDTILILEAE